MPDAGSATPATAAADELLRLTTKVLANLDQDEAAFEAEQVAKRSALAQLVERDRDAVTRATERLNELYRAARAIADNKGRRDVLEGVLRRDVPLDTDTTFDELDATLENELKLARGITGAMRVPDIGRLLNQAAVQVDHLENRANELEARLAEASAPDQDSPARLRFAEAIAELRTDLDSFNAALPLPARPLTDGGWPTWSPPAEASPVLRLGQFTDSRLGESSVPALIEVPTGAGFVIEPARKRAQAIDAARAFLLRALAAFPPGHARFTFLDPKGLGDSIAPFLHLVHLENGVVDGLFTTDRDIERQLEALLERVEHPSADGRCTILFVFDHPIGLSARSIGLVRTLTEVGPRSGMFTVVVKDSKTGSHPRESRALPALRTIRATKDGFETEAAEARRPILLDDAPSPELIEHIGAQVVEVTVEQPVPEADVDLRDESTWWDADARDALDLPLGSASVTFDATTSIAVAQVDERGLPEALHRALASVTTRFAPSEVQLHLIGLGDHRDFVDYAQRRLPHARLVGLDGDRELVVTALESAQAEMARRMVLFQALGVLRDGYAAYRREAGSDLARVVIVIDDATTLFDRHDALRRQIDDLLAAIALDGATAGVHLLLVDRGGPGSTGVTAALPDGPISVVAVDEHVGGLPTDGAERGGLLRALRLLADHERLSRAPAVVDGTAQASMEGAPLDLLSAVSSNGRVAAPRLWLGEPLGLGAPVEVGLTRHDDENLAILTSDPVLGQGMVAGAVTTAALIAGRAAEVHLIDFAPLEDGFSAYATALRTPASIHLSRRRNLARSVDAVRNQLVNRLARPGADAPAWLLVLNGIHLVDGPLVDDPDLAVLLRHLPQIVHEGPKVGIHTILWGTHPSAETTIGPDVWRAFGVRVLGPATETESRAVIDSPIAATLAPNQAVLNDEVRARVVRFRPYALARPEWAASLGSRPADLPAVEPG